MDDEEGVEKLAVEDPVHAEKQDDGAVQPADEGKGHGAATGTGADGPHLIDNAKSSRSTCKGCSQKIEKGEVRVSSMVPSESLKFRGKIPAWRHVKCFLEAGWLVIPLEELQGWDTLTADDQNMVQDLAKPFLTNLVAEGSKKRKASAVDEKTSTDGQLVEKRARKEGGGDASVKNGKVTESTAAVVPKKKGRPRKVVVEKVDDPVDRSPVDPELEKKLDKQKKAIGALMDNLQKHVSMVEIKKMLTANHQDATGSENDLRERCADGMMFGVLDKCPMCSSPVEYQGGPFRCKGFRSTHPKCSYTTFTPARLRSRWQIPEGTTNEFLLQWYKSRKVKAERLYLPSSPKHEGKILGKPDSTTPSLDGPLAGVMVTILGRLSQSQAKWKELIEGAGGRLVSTITSDTKYVIASESDLEKHEDKLQQAQNLKIPVLREAFLTDCLEQKNGISYEPYIIEVKSDTSVVKVKMQERSAVHEDSGLQGKGHVLEDGKAIYNMTLNKCDKSGKNSYYILQIIEEDGSNMHTLFRKWGRVGSRKSKKSEKFSRPTAINEFKRLFLEKTGNEWESWEKKEKFEKQSGKYYPAEIEDSMDDDAPSEEPEIGSRSKLDFQLLNLMKLLFDVKRYRATMLEYGIKADEMPFEKLSKLHIEQGFAALTEIQGHLVSDSLSAEQKKTALTEASNRFFALIPATKPHTIDTEDEVRSKVEMLEALRDMEIASNFIGAREEVAGEDPLDTHYKRLCCDIAPLPQNSAEYRLVKKYLERTNANKEWVLELEDVFVVNRDGEAEKFEPFKKKMKNHMLLWHGSRTTSYVSILSQGLRIAPQEAPVAGYMFGKGVYFSDLVSKCAERCHPSRNDPTCLMLVCEVALGKVHELKSPQHIEKLPRGMNSTKGIGSTKPNESEFEKFRGNVTVPCGRPVPSGVQSTDLLYNEYVIYDPAQVKARFLLKVRLKYK